MEQLAIGELRVIGLRCSPLGVLRRPYDRAAYARCVHNPVLCCLGARGSHDGRTHAVPLGGKGPNLPSLPVA